MTDFTKIYYEADIRYDIGVALLELAVIVLGIVLVAMFLLRENNRKKVLKNLCIALVALVIVSIIVLKVILSVIGYGGLGDGFYTLFTGFMATAITVMVSSVLMIISYMLLLRQQNAEPANSAQTETEQKEQSAPSNDTISDN